VQQQRSEATNAIKNSQLAVPHGRLELTKTRASVALRSQSVFADLNNCQKTTYDDRT
jgi:hypothetical protein